VPARDREGVLAVERDPGTHGRLAVDVVVLVHQDAVAAAEPPTEGVELVAELGVPVRPRVPREPPLSGRRLRGVGVVAERR
jgi:hypothetical protein